MLDDSLTAGHRPSTSEPEPSASTTVGDSDENSGTRESDPSARRNLAVGDRFAGFQIRGMLGRGAMGVVYEAWDPTLERRVALKLLRSPSKRAAERLLREARALARLDHPGVVRIWAADVHRGAVYIAMELVEGQNLREWLRTERSWSDVLPVIIGAARGLAAAHAAGVIHRDFKPENVLVGWDGQARVLDFGIARVSAQHPDHLVSTVDSSVAEDRDEDEDEDGDEDENGEGHETGGIAADDARTRAEPDADAEARSGVERLSGSFAVLPITSLGDASSNAGLHGDNALTEAGALIGTLLYMAPEQHDREPADERSDQFAFCTTLFEAIYRAHPFPARNRGELALLVSEGNIKFPNDDRSKAPRWLERVILKGLSPARADRFATIDDLIDALERYPRRRRVRNRVLAAMAVASGAIALGVMAPRADPIDPCVDVASELDVVLGARQRGEIAARVMALEVPWAGEMSKRVAATLESWAGRWVEARTEVCELRHAHREPTVIDARREACLDEQLAEIGALGIVLTDAQQRVLTNVERALTVLPDPSVCVGDEPPVERMAGDGELDDGLVKELLELEWLTVAGGDSETLERALTLAANVRELPPNKENQSLLASVLVTLAEVKLLVGENAEAEALFHEAIRIAERIGADGIRAQAVVDLGWVLATTSGGPGRADEAVVVLEHAAALIERVGNPRVEAARQRQGLAEALLASGQPARAREVFEAVLADAGTNPPLSTLVTTLFGLSRVAAFENDYEGALEHSRAALKLLESRGKDTPEAATALTNMGDALSNLGRYDEARDVLQRSLKLRRALLRGEADAGKRRRVGEGLMNLGNLESKAGRGEVAAEFYSEALSLIPEDDYANRSLVLFNLGVNHQFAGRTSEALAHYQDSLRFAERVLPLDSPQVVVARLGVGSMLVTLDRHAEARGPLERALADWPESKLGDMDEAELRFALAQALFALEGWSENTQIFAESAARLYRRLGDPVSADSIDAWLAAHGPRVPR